MAASHIVIVGGGNAGLCAALSAREQGADVTVLEAAPEAERGGNSAFTAGAMRVAYQGVDDLLKLMPELTKEDRELTDFGSYSESQFMDDMGRVTDYRCDPALTSLLISESLGTLMWMREKGIRFLPVYGRQAFKVDGKFTFWGGLTVEVTGGGPGLVNTLHECARREGIEVLYERRAVGLLERDGAACGVVVRHNGKREEVAADAVVLASGGFQANAEWRTRYLGPGWDLARVRGTRFNTGEGIRMALEMGAIPWGNWSGCHAVGWDLNAPPFGNLAVGDGYQKHSYPFGIMVNGDGERFVDEGADFRNYTYAKYGRLILNQPGQFAWQVFDGRVRHLLRDEYRIREASKVSAPTLEELATRMEGVDQPAFLETVSAFNAAVNVDQDFNPNIKDARATVGLRVNKSNWANPLDTPPYEAYAVTCGITFTFGGLRITEQGGVLDTAGKLIPGLFACGELVGGIFYFNYPGGTGLTSGAVFGRLAGRAAAAVGSTGDASTPPLATARHRRDGDMP
ncbi:MAG: FAD-dependent tricarballylate dehydrogenase TcuA [Candidatus Dormibacter sp.]